MKSHRFLTRVGVSLLAMTMAAEASAQTTTAAPAGTQPAQTTPPASNTESPSGEPDQVDAVGGAGEIVVTANKREQNLNEVGLSVAAFGAEQLEIRRVATVADLAQVTPGLTFAPTPTATPVYTLRGVGFFDSTIAAYPDVSLYIDQVPLSLPVMSTLTAFDLERVEVLKGPQGTLFGNNATGGAINLIAAKPTSTSQGGMEFGFSRFNTIGVSGFVSGPISDTLAFRLAAKTEQSSDGWQRSYTRNDDLGKKNNVAARLLLDWNPTSRLKFALNLNMWQDKNETQAPQKIASSPQNPVPAGFLITSYPNAPLNNRSADWGPNRPYANTRFKQAALRTDYDLDFATLTSLTSYSDTKFLNGTEGGGTAFEDLDIAEDRAHVKSFTQELRLANGGNNRFRWVLGGNYERTTVNENTALYYRYTSATLVNGIVNSTYATDHKMRNYAGFGNVEFDLTDQLTLKGGVRRTRAERDFVAINHDDPNFPQGINPNTGTTGLPLTTFFNAVYGFIGPLLGGTIPTIAPGGSIILDTRTNANGTPVNPATYLKPGQPQTALRENNTSWSAGVDFKATPDLLFYANVARGYKAGSLPHVSGSIYTAYQPVVQESLTDYEAGFKLQAFDRKVSITGAGFYYDYRNKQLRAKFVDPIFGSLDLLVNVPKSRIYGGEFTIDARPFDGLTLSASGTYLNTKVQDYTGAVGIQIVNGLQAPVNASFAGVPLPFAPKFQYSARADYDTPVSSSMNVFFGAGVDGQTKSVATLVFPGSTVFGVPANLYDINSRALVNAQFGLHDADDKWKVTVWGKNLFNKYYWTNAIQAYDTFVRYTGMPVTYGISAAFKF